MAEIHISEEELLQREEELEKLKSRLESEQKKSAELESALNSAHAELAAIRMELERRTGQAAASAGGTDIDGRKESAELANVREELALEVKRRSELEAKMRLKLGEFDEVIQLVHSLRLREVELKDIEQKLANASRTHAEEEKKIAAKWEEVRAKEDTIDKTLKEVEVRKRENDERAAALAEKEKELQNMLDEVRKKEEDMNVMFQKLDAMKKELEHESQKILEEEEKLIKKREKWLEERKQMEKKK